METKFRVINNRGEVKGYEALFPTDILDTNYEWARSGDGYNWESGVMEGPGLIREIFTGIYDKDNTEIYAGDIVKRGCLDDNCNLEHHGEVIFSNKWGIWGINDKSQDRSGHEFPAPLVWGAMNVIMGLEIIGHRFRNPELL